MTGRAARPRALAAPLVLLGIAAAVAVPLALATVPGATPHHVGAAAPPPLAAAAVVAGAALAAARLRRHRAPARRWLLTGAGLAVIAGSVAWPPGAGLSGLGYHMVQHGIVSTLAAPLLVAGLLVHPPRARPPRPLSAVLTPAVAWVAFVAAQWVAHAPVAIGWAEGGSAQHLALHAGLLAVSVLFWTPVLGRAAAPRRLRGGLRPAYLAVALPPLDGIALWYAMMGETAAAGLMLLSMLPLPAMAVAVAWSWMRRQEQRARRWEAACEERGWEAYG